MKFYDKFNCTSDEKLQKTRTFSHPALSPAHNNIIYRNTHNTILSSYLFIGDWLTVTVINRCIN